MDPGIAVAAIGGIVTVSVTVLGIAGSVINARLNFKLDKAEVDRLNVAEKTEEQLAGLSKTTNEIHNLTNSNLAATNARLDESVAETKSLRLLIEEMRRPTTGPVEVVVKEKEA